MFWTRFPHSLPAGVWADSIQPAVLFLLSYQSVISPESVTSHLLLSICVVSFLPSSQIRHERGGNKKKASTDKHQITEHLKQKIKPNNEFNEWTSRLVNNRMVTELKTQTGSKAKVIAVRTKAFQNKTGSK